MSQPNQHTKRAEAAAALAAGRPIPHAPVPHAPAAPVAPKAAATPKRKRRTKAEIAAKPESTQIAIVLQSHKDKIQELEAKFEELEQLRAEAQALIALVGGNRLPNGQLLLPASIGVARRSWYRPWMGGVVLGLVMTILCASWIHSCTKAPTKAADADASVTWKTDLSTKPLSGQCFGCSDSQLVYMGNNSPYSPYSFATVNADGVPVGKRRTTGRWERLTDDNIYEAPVATPAPVKSRRSKVVPAAVGQPVDAGVPAADAPAPSAATPIADPAPVN